MRMERRSRKTGHDSFGARIARGGEIGVGDVFRGEMGSEMYFAEGIR